MAAWGWNQTSATPTAKRKKKREKRNNVNNVAYDWLITELWLIILNEKTHLEATKWANVKV